MVKAFAILLISLLPAADLHPLHVTVTEINYDEKDKALEIMMRIFADDLETTLRKAQNVPDLDVTNPKPMSLDEMMRSYLSTNFAISLDGKSQTVNYIGNERDGAAFIFYIEVPKVRKWSKISVTNAVLTEVFDDQSNLVHVTVGEEVKSLRLNKSNPSQELAFVK